MAGASIAAVSSLGNSTAARNVGALTAYLTMNIATDRTSSNPPQHLPSVRPNDAAWALFLDFDGTLVDLTTTPNQVAVTPRLRTILGDCATAFDNAIAIVSGRPIATLDALLNPLRLPAAGLHGLELRLPNGTVERSAHRDSELAELRPQFLALVRSDERLFVEDKGVTLALHFRRAPEREDELRALITTAVPSHDIPYQVLHGKMVVEVKPAGTNKGNAIARYLKTPIFSGRRPVFAGDDVTDEDGFEVVNQLGGISIKVGAGESKAAYRVADTDALLDWLTILADTGGDD